MRDAGLRTIAAVWWAPPITLAVIPGLAFSWGVNLRLRLARRLAVAGRRDAALRVYAAVQADIATDLRRVRGQRTAP